jgi:hypothetical protein
MKKRNGNELVSLPKADATSSPASSVALPFFQQVK